MEIYTNGIIIVIFKLLISPLRQFIIPCGFCLRWSLSARDEERERESMT